MLDLLSPRLTIYLLSKKQSVPKYIYTKPPTYNTSPIVVHTRFCPVIFTCLHSFLNCSTLLFLLVPAVSRLRARGVPLVDSEALETLMTLYNKKILATVWPTIIPRNPIKDSIRLRFTHSN